MPTSSGSAIENRHVLERFNLQYLGGKYPYAVLLEGNDERGIDVGLLFQPVGTLRTNVFTANPAERKRRDGGSARLFNRDCLEVAVELPGGRGDVTVGVTHFKSKGGGEIETDGKRLRQASEVARASSPSGTRATVNRAALAILGDLNERPDRDGANGAMLEGHKTSIDPLLVHAGLSDVIGQTLGPDKAYTHIEQRRGGIARSQIDYILLSPRRPAGGGGQLRHRPLRPGLLEPESPAARPGGVGPCLPLRRSRPRAPCLRQFATFEANCDE